MRPLNVDIAAGTALTDDNAETALCTYTFPANFFQAGTVVKFSALIRTTAQNSTDTLTIKAKLGGTTLVTTAAVDQAVSDGTIVEGTLICREGPTADSAIVAFGLANDPDATKQALYEWHVAPTDFATDGALSLTVTGTWSVASASNSCRSDGFNVFQVC